MKELSMYGECVFGKPEDEESKEKCTCDTDSEMFSCIKDCDHEPK